MASAGIVLGGAFLPDGGSVVLGITVISFYIVIMQSCKPTCGSQSSVTAMVAIRLGGAFLPGWL